MESGKPTLPTKLNNRLMAEITGQLYHTGYLSVATLQTRILHLILSQSRIIAMRLSRP